MENETIIEEENNSENQPKQVEKTKNVFCYKNFTLTFLGAFVSNLGNTLYLFAVSFYILSLTNNNAFIQGAYLATGGIVYVLVTLFGGVISDRFHKGKIMFMCDYAKGGMLIAFTLLLMLVIQDPSAKVVVLFIIAVLGNIIAAIFSPAASSLLPRIVPEKSYQQAQSYNSLMQSSLGVLGVILAAILYSVLDIHVLFFIVGGCYVLSGVSEMFIKYDYQKNEDKLTVKQVFKDIGDGMKYIGKLKPLLFLMLGILLLNFFVSPLSANFLPYFVATDVASRNYLFSNFLTPEMWSSVIQVAYAIGMIIMAIQDNESVKSITVIEKNPDVIAAVKDQLPLNDKVRIIEGDVYTYVPDRKYDCVYMDIWGDISEDTYTDMVKLKRKYGHFLKPLSESPKRFNKCWAEYNAKNGVPF